MLRPQTGTAAYEYYLRGRQHLPRMTQPDLEKSSDMFASAACLHAKAGQKDQALGFLERVFARGWGKRDWVEHDPDYDILRDDPRFQKLLARLK